MMSFRRTWVAVALSLAASAALLPAVTHSQPAPAFDAAAFAGCLEGMRPQAQAAGVSASSFDRFTRGLAPQPEVLGFLDAQPEFVTPIWDYLSALADDERVADGRGMLARWREVLDRVETQFGVDPATVVAVWGVESDFGRRFGERPLLQSLSTLACYGRRQSFFRGEFLTSLKILQEGHVQPDKLRGSWAGAFGHTQFMPSTFMRLAVDFDGDGRRDLVDSIPDALASTANFLKRAGWRSALPWGFEVRLPSGFDASAIGRRNRQPLSTWSAQGVRRIDGRPLAQGALRDDTPVALLRPAEKGGPVFLVTGNFNALFQYNAAESYALAIAHLADRMRGGGPFVTPWPTDDPGLSRAERRELQQLLVARGHDIGVIDGLIGKRTLQALNKELALLGVQYAGDRVGRKALNALRAARSVR
jgi:lytic murein transglycosylase